MNSTSPSPVAHSAPLADRPVSPGARLTFHTWCALALCAAPAIVAIVRLSGVLGEFPCKRLLPALASYGLLALCTGLAQVCNLHHRVFYALLATIYPLGVLSWILFLPDALWHIPAAGCMSLMAYDGGIGLSIATFVWFTAAFVLVHAIAQIRR